MGHVKVARFRYFTPLKLVFKKSLRESERGELGAIQMEVITLGKTVP